MLRRLALLVIPAVLAGVCLPTQHASAATVAPVEGVAVAAVSSFTVTTRPWPSVYGSLSGVAGAVCHDAARWWSTVYVPNRAAIGADPNRIQIGVKLEVACSSTATTSRTRPTSRSSSSSHAPTASSTSSSRIGKVLAYARAHIGAPYVWAATGPYGFDCSGLVVASYARVGVYLPHQSQAMLSRGRAVSRANLRPGDVLIYRPGTLYGGNTGHAQMYLGGGKVIESGRGGVHIRDLPAARYFWAARRMVG